MFSVSTTKMNLNLLFNIYMRVKWFQFVKHLHSISDTHICVKLFQTKTCLIGCVVYGVANEIAWLEKNLNWMTRQKKVQSTLFILKSSGLGKYFEIPVVRLKYTERLTDQETLLFSNINITYYFVTLFHYMYLHCCKKRRKYGIMPNELWTSCNVRFIKLIHVWVEKKN